MFHVSRNAVVPFSRSLDSRNLGSEALEETHPDIQLFFKSTAAAEPGFEAVDAGFVRVLEDLIDTLILKNVIHQTDLPPAAQKKLMVRKGLRSRIHGALNLLGNDDRLI